MLEASTSAEGLVITGVRAKLAEIVDPTASSDLIHGVLHFVVRLR